MPWVKGQSGNPKGAPRRSDLLAKLIREQTRNGLDLVEFNLRVLRGEETAEVATKTGVVTVGPSIADRHNASRWLADRGWGKAVEHIEIADERAPEVNPTTIAPELLEAELGPTGALQ